MMSTEKIVKKQAKSLLEKNWIPVICAALLVCIVLILIDSLFSLIAISLNCIDINSGDANPNRMTEFVLCFSLKSVIVIAASPLINGTLKTVCNAACIGQNSVKDIFYFFKSANKYCKTVILNAVLFSIFYGLSRLLDPYAAAELILGTNLNEELNNPAQTAILIAALVFSVIIRIFIYLLFAHYPLFLYSINDSMPLTRYAFGLIGFSARHLGSALKLAISFLGWFALCFFVVPAFYVFPYAAISAAASAKWLAELDRNRGALKW